MDLKSKIEIIGRYHAELQKRQKTLAKRIDELMEHGCIDATEYWKDGKYLYLLYKMKDGKREKTYIGMHPARIKEARQKLENFKIRLSCIATLQKVELDLGKIETGIDQLLTLCSRYDLAARFALLEKNEDKIEYSRWGSI